MQASKNKGIKDKKESPYKYISRKEKTGGKQHITDVFNAFSSCIIPIEVTR